MMPCKAVLQGIMKQNQQRKAGDTMIKSNFKNKIGHILLRTTVRDREIFKQAAFHNNQTMTDALLDFIESYNNQYLNQTTKGRCENG